MGKTVPLASQDTRTDDVICSDELEAMQDIAREVEGDKRTIVLEAAEKLAIKYQDEPRVICSRLQKLFAKDHVTGNTTRYATVSRRWIYTVLPEQYKREYRDPDEAPTPADYAEVPINDAEEALALLADAFREAADLMDNNLQQLYELRGSGVLRDKKDYSMILNEIERNMSHANITKTMRAVYLKELCTCAQTKDFVKFVKKLSADIAAAKKLADRRIKFSTCTKILLRMIFVAPFLRRDRRQAGQQKETRREMDERHQPRL